MWYIISFIMIILGIILALLPSRYFRKLNNSTLGFVMIVVGMDLIALKIIIDSAKVIL